MENKNITIIQMIEIIILGLVVFTGLIGCDYNLKKENKKTEKIEIEFWYGLNGYSNQLMKQLIYDFNNSQDKYYVLGINQSNSEDTFKALKSSIARKRVPDTVLLENQHLKYLASKGVILKLNNFINKYIEIEDFIDLYLEQDKIKEDIIGVPMYGRTQVLYYRRDFFKQHNIKAVDLLTWESVEKVARKLTRKNNDEILVYGWEFMYGIDNLIDAAISNGGSFLDDSGEKIKINSIEWIEAWEYFRKLIHDDNVMKVHYGGEDWNHRYATIDDVMQGRAAGYIGSCGDQSEIDSKIIGVYMLPSWENKLNNPRGVVKLQSLCIPSDIEEDKKIASFEWIKYLTNSNTNLLWSTSTGFLPVRKSAMDKENFYNKILENPDYFIPISQVKLGTKIFIDPTDGKIYEILKLAAYKVLIQNIPPEEALNDAQEKAQFILDEMLNKGR